MTRCTSRTVLNFLPKTRLATSMRRNHCMAANTGIAINQHFTPRATMRAWGPSPNSIRNGPPPQSSKAAVTASSAPSTTTPNSCNLTSNFFVTIVIKAEDRMESCARSMRKAMPPANEAAKDGSLPSPATQVTVAPSNAMCITAITSLKDQVHRKCIAAPSLFAISSAWSADTPNIVCVAPNTTQRIWCASWLIFGTQLCRAFPITMEHIMPFQTCPSARSVRRGMIGFVSTSRVSNCTASAATLLALTGSLCVHSTQASRL
mmetsp:Transcript_62224/g.115485  ORF Transcript_62224/g.115485 Transcript_62224/m.115485 type:complete len:262 (+) Transcript_62224:406-1191(+)